MNLEREAMLGKLMQRSSRACATIFVCKPAKPLGESASWIAREGITKMR